MLQGDILSPMLFSLFLEDLETHLHENLSAGIDIDQINIFLLLFADDLAIISETPNGLQKHLNTLHTYCERWGLTVNIDKTKVMIFQKGRTRKGYNFCYNNKNLEIVDSFAYLGTVLSPNGLFNKHVKITAEKTLQLYNTFMYKTQKLSLDCKTMMELFDVACSSKMNYGAEVWGYTNAKDLERVHLKFCKRLLGVKTSTCTPAVYCELGRKPLLLTRTLRIIKYWFKVLRSQNCLMKSIYDYDLKNMLSSWIIFVKNTLLSNGFGDVWYYPESVNEKMFYVYFEQRLSDCFYQNLRVEIENAHPLRLYKYLNLPVHQAEYLNHILYDKHRKALSRLRLSSHRLRIESGR